VTAGLLLLAMVVVFFPTLYWGRVISPLDCLAGEAPWSELRSPVEVTNPELREPATTFVPQLLARSREGWSTAVWSPFQACGEPGAASWDRGLLSIGVLPFAGWLDPRYLLNAMVLTTLVLAFAGTWLLARQAGLDEAPAGVAAAAFALAAPLTARWLEPGTSGLAALPLLLWGLREVLASRHPGRWAGCLALLCLALLGCGHGATVAVGCVVALGWTVRWLVAPRLPVAGPRLIIGRLTAIVAAGLMAAAILAPALTLTARRSPAASPPTVSLSAVQVAHLLMSPFAFGDPRQESFDPPAGLDRLGLDDLCLSVGWLVAGLALVGVVRRPRAAGGWTTVAAGCLVVLVSQPAAAVLRWLPGLDRLQPPVVASVLALALALVAGHGAASLAGHLEQRLPSRLVRLLVSPRRAPEAAGRRRVVLAVVVLLAAGIVFEQGMLAGHLLAYLPPSQAVPPSTPGLELVRDELARRPARVAPLLDALPPEMAAAVGLEDLRAAGPVDPGYRRWLELIDPQASGSAGSGLRLSPVTADMQHPYLAALGARWLLEPPDVSLVEFALGRRTTEVEPRDTLLPPLMPGSRLVQEVRLPPGCSRVGLHGVLQGRAARGRLQVRLLTSVGRADAGGAGVELGRWTPELARFASSPLVWIDLPEGVAGQVRLEIAREPAPVSLRTWAAGGGEALPGRLLLDGRELQADLALSFDTSGLVLRADGPDLRVWENRRALDRVWVVHRVIPGTLATVLDAEPPLQLDQVAVVDPASLGQMAGWSEPGYERDSIRALTVDAGAVDVLLELARPGLLVSSIPASSGLWHARVDGQPRSPIVADGLLVALPLNAGAHHVELRAQLPWVWYVCSLAGITALVVLLTAAGVGRLRRRAACSRARTSMMKP